MFPKKMGDSSSDVRCHTKNIKSRYIIFKSCSRRKTETYISFGDKTQRENVENGTRTFYKHNASQQQNIPHFSKRSASCRCRKQLQNEFSFVTVHENRVVNGIIVCVFMVNTTTSYYYDIQNKFKGIFNLTRKRNKTHLVLHPTWILHPAVLNCHLVCVATDLKTGISYTVSPPSPSPKHDTVLWTRKHDMQ